jgi:hydrogenase-4 component F
MLEIVFVFPMIMGLLCFVLPKHTGRYLVVITAVVNFALVIMDWTQSFNAQLNPYFQSSPEGQIVLFITSILFLVVSLYSFSYMTVSKIDKVRIYCGSLLLFQAAMMMVTISNHIMVLWIAIETTTLASAPLILVHSSKKSLEATWKYILICSVGIALALLGSILIVVSLGVGGATSELTFSNLQQIATQLDSTWLKAAFIFILVGYGTKMGLFPMHTWLPDAHSEAPSPVSALLSGALLNCAYLGIYKTYRIVYNANLGSFAGTLLIIFGLLSVVVAATFIIRQNDYKRLFAYSSIENMGIIALGAGIGGLAAYGSFLHLIHHSLVKSSLFLSTGNVLLAYNSKEIEQTGSMAGQIPKTTVGYLGGVLGISGFPPMGLFLSELLIIFGAFQQNQFVVVAVLIVFLIIIGAGMMKNAIQMSFGDNKTTRSKLNERLMLVSVPVLLLLLSVIFCFWLPESIHRNLMEAVSAIGGVLHV